MGMRFEDACEDLLATVAKRTTGNETTASEEEVESRGGPQTSLGGASTEQSGKHLVLYFTDTLPIVRSWFRTDPFRTVLRSVLAGPYRSTFRRDPALNVLRFVRTVLRPILTLPVPLPVPCCHMHAVLVPC